MHLYLETFVGPRQSDGILSSVLTMLHSGACILHRQNKDVTTPYRGVVHVRAGRGAAFPLQALDLKP